MSELTVIASYPLLAAAQVAQAALEAEGIPVVLRNGEIVNANWLLGIQADEVNLLVPAEHAAAAHAALTAKRLNESRRRDAEVATERCLACNAIWPAEAMRCPACGWSFADGASDPL